jgi:hypothetical protein
MDAAATSTSPSATRPTIRPAPEPALLREPPLAWVAVGAGVVPGLAAVAGLVEVAAALSFG